METLCDNTSVGVIIENSLREILLLDRARVPFGLAAPAGHVDDHGSLELAAVTEVNEEVGLVLPISGLNKVIDARRVDNQCRRQNGDHHIWTVYTTTEFSGELRPSIDETKGARWYSPQDLRELARHKPNTFEPLWLSFLVELGFIPA